jgi:hypothetical protein
VPQDGEEITVGWGLEQTHLFSKKNGKAIAIKS